MAFVGAGLGTATRSVRTARICVRHGRRTFASMALTAGTALPLDRELMVMEGGKPTTVRLSDVFSGRKVVVFTIPGALTPTCTDSHAPEYASALADLRAKGVDDVVCLSVNDPFVMDAYRKKVDADGAMKFLADGDAGLVKELGIELDTGAFGGVRARRGSFIVDDGKFTHVNLEEGGAFDGPSKVATVLSQL